MQEIDLILSDKHEQQGGFSSTLSWPDRLRLRAVVKKIHMKHYPLEFVTDAEADKMIDAIAPATAAYLIEQNWGKF
jgi:hypothetical protein